jgi:hypothetical protein
MESGFYMACSLFIPGRQGVDDRDGTGFSVTFLKIQTG